MLKTIPGPTFKLDSALPCGCKISRDDDTKQMRMWYCTTHAAAFEVLEALRSGVDALDGIMKQMSPHLSLPFVKDAEVKARSAIRKATVG
jgi:hypothetical protein